MDRDDVVEADAVAEDDVVVFVDVKNSGGPSLVHGLAHRGRAAEGKPSEDPPAPENSQDIAEIVALSRRSWGYDPVLFKCPYCKTEDYSANHLEHTPYVWAGVAFLCMIGCGFGCCLVPFCVDRLKNVKHTCPKCGNVVGVHRACSCCTFGKHRACCCGEDDYASYISELSTNLPSTLPPPMPSLRGTDSSAAQGDNRNGAITNQSTASRAV